jgi:hypothetical protein
MAALENGLVRLPQIEGDLNSYCAVRRPHPASAISQARRASRGLCDFVSFSRFALSIAAAPHFGLGCGRLLLLKHDRDISGD